MVPSPRHPHVRRFDICSASRNSIDDPLSQPFNLGSNVNSYANESRPSLSWNGKTLLFETTRPGVEGASDVYYATRDRIPGLISPGEGNR